MSKKVKYSIVGVVAALGIALVVLTAMKSGNKGVEVRIEPVA